jgi:hypothetical protein
MEDPYPKKDAAKLFEVSMPAIRYAWLGASSFDSAPLNAPGSSASAEPSSMSDKNRPSSRDLLRWRVLFAFRTAKKGTRQSSYCCMVL